jgi:hypothetical protein
MFVCTLYRKRAPEDNRDNPFIMRKPALNAGFMFSKFKRNERRFEIWLVSRLLMAFACVFV